MADSTLELVPVTNEEEIRRKRRRKRKRVGAVLVVAMMTMISDWYYRKRPRHIVDADEVAERNVMARKQMLRNLYQGSNVYCYDSLRQTKRSFSDLCAILRERCGLHDTLNVSVEEKVAIFMLIVGHGMKMRVIRSTYGLSLEPISRHFNEVLRGILSLSHEFIKLPDPSAVQPEDYKWKWFEDCLGALDGTHIDVLVPLADQGRYRNRKQKITTNVLGVCDRHMKFVYVLAGWEGSASDSRVLRDAMTREDAFAVPNGKYYLVDAGYTNGPGFLAPYRSTRYQLNEWAAQGNNPSTAREPYNLRHASARNVIERTFGLLKMRWAILSTNTYFDLKNQKHKEASTYRHKVVKFWDSISIVYCKDHATGEASRTASECSKEMTKEDNTSKEDGSTSSASLKRQRSDDSFTSMISKKMDVVVEALKDDGPKGPTAEEIRVALDEISGLDEDTYLDLYDILTSNARKFESMMVLPMERRRR